MGIFFVREYLYGSLRIGHFFYTQVRSDSGVEVEEFGGEGTRGRRERGEAEAVVGVEPGHELPGVDDFGLRRRRGFREEASEARRRGGRSGGGGRWVEGEEAVGGGGERDDVVAKSIASDLGELVVLV